MFGNAPPGAVLFLFILGLIALWTIMQFVLFCARGAGSLMSRAPLAPPAQRAMNHAEAAVSAGERTAETAETPQHNAENETEMISFAETQRAEALARLVREQKINLTDAVKIGCAAKSGERYQKQSRLIKAAIERLDVPEVFDAESGQRVPMTHPITRGTQ